MAYAMLAPESCSALQCAYPAVPVYGRICLQHNWAVSAALKTYFWAAGRPARCVSGRVCMLRLSLVAGQDVMRSGVPA